MNGLMERVHWKPKNTHFNQHDVMSSKYNHNRCPFGKPSPSHLVSKTEETLPTGVYLLVLKMDCKQRISESHKWHEENLTIMISL